MKLKTPLSLFFSPLYLCTLSCFLPPFQLNAELGFYWFLQEISHSPSLFHIPFTSLLPHSLLPCLFPSFSSPVFPLPFSLPDSSSLYLLPFLSSGAAFASFFSVSRLIKASFCFNKGKSVPKWGGGGGWGITPAVKSDIFSSL